MRFINQLFDFPEPGTEIEKSMFAEIKPERLDISEEYLENVTVATKIECEFITCQPYAFDQVMEIIQNFTEGRTIILNLNMIDSEMAQRILDYLCGSMISLNGKQTLLGQGIFMFSHNVMLVTNNSEHQEIDYGQYQIAA